MLVSLTGPSKTQDTQTLSSRPNNNFDYAESNTTYIWPDNGQMASKNFLIKFDIPSSIDPNDITVAELSFFFNPTDPYETFDYSYAYDRMQLRRITPPWDSSTVTWNTQPTATSTNNIITPYATSITQNFSGYDALTVTDLVKDMLTYNNYGFNVRIYSASNHRSFIFGSSTHSNPRLHPHLFICHNPSGKNKLDSNEELITLSPNPVNEKLTISVSDKFVNSVIEIYSLVNGELVMNEILKDETNNFNVFELKKGTYFVKIINSEAKIVTKKFIKQ